MARNFINIPYTPWRGIPQSVEISLCKPTVSPRAMVVDIDWDDPQYNQSDAVKVDLTPQGATQPLDKIVCLKVDNSGSSHVLYIQFPDSSDVITILPASIVVVPVLTNQMTFVVYIDQRINILPKVRIHALNVYVDPSQEFEVVVSTPQEVNSFGSMSARALGDITLSYSLDLTSTALNVVLRNPPFGGSPSALILTAIRAQIYACYNLTAVEAFIRLDDPIGATIRQWAFGVGPDLRMFGATVLEQSGGLQIKSSGLQIPFSGASGMNLKNFVALSAGKMVLDFAVTRTNLIS